MPNSTSESGPPMQGPLADPSSLSGMWVRNVPASASLMTVGLPEARPSTARVTASEAVPEARP